MLKRRYLMTSLNDNVQAQLSEDIQKNKQDTENFISEKFLWRNWVLFEDLHAVT